MRNIAIATLLCLSMLVGPGAAMAGPDRRALAMRLSKLMLTQTTYQEMISQVTQSMGGSGMRPEVSKKMTVVVGEALPYREMLEFNVAVYAKHFDEAELSALIEFYKTPVGKKLSTKLPAISAEVAARTTAILPERLPPLMKKHGLSP